ncbi:hypothetical protein [Agromyces humi]|uniref:hypothetical protein n=1 Tax=Agromyces humi TaxID=1766800 RepID=UPI00135A9EF0|nr:hypothetical protein [Agromyces humi]
MSSIASSPSPEDVTPLVNAADDVLAMLSALEQIETGFPYLAHEQAAGLTMERRVTALAGLARLMMRLIEMETGATNEQVIAKIREQLVLASAGL